MTGPDLIPRYSVDVYLTMLAKIPIAIMTIKLVSVILSIPYYIVSFIIHILLCRPC